MRWTGGGHFSRTASSLILVRNLPRHPNSIPGQRNSAAVMEGKKPGGWKAVEIHMANWAQRNGKLRRTDQACLRRFIKLEPEKYEEHLRVSQPVVWRVRES